MSEKSGAVNHLPKAAGQPTTTYLGSPITPIPPGLPKKTKSLCPECKKLLDAVIFEEEGKVWMEKECPTHGKFRDLVWSDAELYLKAEKWYFGDNRGLLNPKVKNATVCPYQCGLCNLHLSHTVMVNIDLTNRCDLTCPVCFANANVTGYVYEPSLEEVRTMLKAVRDERPVATTVVQFSGGEPTIYPRFFDVLKMAKELGYNHLQIATNGLNMADLEFAKRAKEAGLHTIYLQFDGVTDDVYMKTRGLKLFKTKLKAIENCRKVGIMVILVPTMIKGVNDHQAGDIVKFGIENADICRGVSFQPVAFTGRISRKEREKQRYTLTDLAWDIERQTNGILRAREDWYPISFVAPFSRFYSAVRGYPVATLTCHPHCSLATYLIINRKDPSKFVPITRVIDVEGLLTEMDKLAEKTETSRFKSFAKIKAFNNLRKHFRSENAPEGLTFTKLLESINGLMDKELRKGGGTEWIAFLVGGMHFMDLYNYDVERVKRCIIHYATPDGSIYPFCTYNGGPTFREKVEKKFSIPLEEWKKKMGKS
ncbi:MAG: radical SAM protein [Acidobacteria bacterium]|nr:radical SAM protein [Acidobacteriota bacterium]